MDLALPDPTVKNEVSGISLGHQKKRCITRGNVFCANYDNEACDTDEFRPEDMEEFLPSLVRVSALQVTSRRQIKGRDRHAIL